MPLHLLYVKNVLTEGSQYNIQKEVSQLAKNHGKFPFMGFYTFGEIGSNLDFPCQLNEQTVTLIVVYDKLLSE